MPVVDLTSYSGIAIPPFDMEEASKIGDRMPAVAESVKVRKPRQVDSEGKLMRRLVLVLSDKDYGTVTSAIVTRRLPLFLRTFGGEAINEDCPGNECQGRALASICEEWTSKLDDK